MALGDLLPRGNHLQQLRRLGLDGTRLSAELLITLDGELHAQDRRQHGAGRAARRQTCSWLCCCCCWIHHRCMPGRAAAVVQGSQGCLPRSGALARLLVLQLLAVQQGRDQPHPVGKRQLSCASIGLQRRSRVTHRLASWLRPISPAAASTRRHAPTETARAAWQPRRCGTCALCPCVCSCPRQTCCSGPLPTPLAGAGMYQSAHAPGQLVQEDDKGKRRVARLPAGQAARLRLLQVSGKL